MKAISKIILFLIIVIPIIVCVITLNKVWNDDLDYNYNDNEVSGDKNNYSGDILNILNSGDDNKNIVSGEMSGEQYVSTIGSPISKIYTDATIAIPVANVYDDADENSEVVGTIEKFTVITAYQYPQGWTRVTDGKISGWMRTDNISFPAGGLINGETEKTGKVQAEGGLNLRASTSTSANILTNIPNGTTIKIIDSKNGWYKTTYASSTGWVSADFVKVN